MEHKNSAGSYSNHKTYKPTTILQYSILGCFLIKEVLLLFKIEEDKNGLLNINQTKSN